MGTRSLTYVYDNAHPKTALVCLYRQYDGYPSGHGKDLAEFLEPMKIVNGISGDGNENKAKANGAGCLAAQIVARFKNGVGMFYLVPTEEGVDHSQEYEYRIYAGAGSMLRLTIKDIYAKKIVFDGSPSAALNWITEQKNA